MGNAPDPGDELVDVIDDDGVITGVVTRREMRARNLPHRTVFIAVVDSQERLVVHQRAHWKDVWPSRWDVCFGGVVGAGEEWRDAAVRELAEEAGVTVEPHELSYLWHGWWEGGGAKELGHVFLARHDGPFTPADGEVATMELVPLAELTPWLLEHDVVDDSLALVVPSLRA